LGKGGAAHPQAPGQFSLGQTGRSASASKDLSCLGEIHVLYAIHFEWFRGLINFFVLYKIHFLE